MLIKTLLKMAYIMLMAQRMEEYRARLKATSSPDEVYRIRAEIWASELDHMRKLELNKAIEAEIGEWYG